MKSRNQSLADAQRQARADKLLGPGYFVLPPKTTLSVTAYREAEVFSVEQALEYIHNWTKTTPNLEIAIQGKYDGASCFLHRDKDGVFTVFTEDGSDVTDRFPNMIKLAKEQFPKTCYIIIGEVEKWIKKGTKRIHQGREYVSGEIHSEGTPTDKAYVWDIYDCIWYDGNDLHSQEYQQRFELLKREFHFSQSLLNGMQPGFNLAPTSVYKTDTEISNALKAIVRFEFLEGAMIKKWNGFKFTLNGHTNDILKFKKYAEAHLWVTDKRTISGSEKTYQYKVAVEVLPTELDEVDENEVIQFKNRTAMVVAKSFNTNVEANVGDIVAVKFHNVFATRNEQNKIVLTLYEPKVFENRSHMKEEPDTVTTLLKIGRDAQLLRYKGADFLPFELVKQLDVFTQYPSEDKMYPFIIHHHWRGKSAHADLRIGHISNQYLIGYTLNVEIPGVAKEPVLTMEEARKQADNDDLWKFNAKEGTFKARQTRGGLKRATSIVVELKAPEPMEWMRFEGVVNPGNVGSTSEFPGVFAIVARGEAEYGFRSGYFHEYWFHAEDWPGGGQKLVFRQLTTEFSASIPINKFLQWALDSDDPIDDFQVTDSSILCDLGEVFLPEDFVVDFGGTISKALPPAEKPEIRTPTMWMLIKPNEPQPYVLSRRAVQKGRITPYGVSALPKAIRNQIPSEYRYWDIREDAKRKQVRDDLFEAIKKGSVKIDLQIFKSVEPLEKGLDWSSIHSGPVTQEEIEQFCNDPKWQELRDSLEGVPLEEKFKQLKEWLRSHGNSRAAQVQVTNYVNALSRGGLVSLKEVEAVERDFILNRRTWRGPIVVRVGYSGELYDLWLSAGDGAQLFTFSSDPRDSNEATGTMSKFSDKVLMESTGELLPGSKLNPNKRIPVKVDRLTKGKLLLLDDNPQLKKFEVKAKDWKGLYLLEQDENTNVWTLKATGSAGQPLDEKPTKEEE